MLTVPEAARRVGRNPETIRRWIRSGRLKARKIGTQHVIEETDLVAASDDDDLMDLPDFLQFMSNGQPQPNWVAIIRRNREDH